MTQRSYNNTRNLNKEYKGNGKKSASSAKIKSKAGSTVYQKTVTAKQKQKKEAIKQKNKEEKQSQRIRSAAVDAQAKHDSRYKRWRKIWIVCVVLAVIGVLSSFLFSWAINEGRFLESLSEYRSPLTFVSLGLGYGGLILALVIDLIPIRKIKKEYKEKVHISKKEEKKIKKELENRAAEKKSFGKKSKGKSNASKKAESAKANNS
ncbi:MAG: hypothetical protein MJ189_01280 [Coriobacteriales bacterium]|nr:hypothetical protein [Coriobacteriales bacterium]